jgi:hypothetical protein
MSASHAIDISSVRPWICHFNSGKKDNGGKPCSASAKNFHDLHKATHTQVEKLC